MNENLAPLGDVAAVEYRVAQLSQESVRPPTSSAATGGSVAAFAALLARATPAYGAPGNGAPASAPVAPAQIESMIARAAAENGEDPALIKAVVANESGFNPAATSPVGAQGLMQLMPGTAADLGVRDAYDPEQNIAGGTRYLSTLLQRFGGDLPSAIAAYNAGPEAVASGHIPAETHAYVDNVLGSYERYRSR